MAPIWGRYGPFFLYGYSVVLGLGVVLALGVTAWLARREGLPSKGTGTEDPLPIPPPEGEGKMAVWFDGMLAAAVGAVLGGRAVYVWLNTAYFAENPAEAARFWLGGLNYHGALLGGLAALWLWARLGRRPYLRVAGLLAPGLALLVAFGWAACAIDGCAYGHEAAPGLLAGDLPDAFGVYAMRYRTQLAGALGGLAVSAAAWWLSARARPATVLWSTLGGLALVGTLVALGRGDPSPVVRGLRLVVWAELGLLLAALLGLAGVWLGRRRDHS